MKIISQVCITLLLLDALAVFILILCGENHWLLVAGYWMILTVKNFCDWRMNHGSD